MKNSQVSNDKLYRIPVEMTCDVYNELAGAKEYPYGPIRIGVRDTHGILIPATEEEYRNYIRTIFNEKKRIEREHKCMIPSPKTGKLIKCTASCKNCKKFKDGAPLSLDAFVDEDGFEAEDTPCEEDSILGELLHEQCVRNLRSVNPLLVTIFEELCEEASQRDIAAVIGKSHRYTRDLIDEMREILNEVVSREDLLS